MNRFFRGKGGTVIGVEANPCGAPVTSTAALTREKSA